jgi:ATP-dependent protease ClpP protease subunit
MTSWWRLQRMSMLAGGQRPVRGFRVNDLATAAPGDGGGVFEMWIYDVIDSWGGYWGVSAKDVVQALQAAGANDVLVHVNSPGGDVFEGLAIYSTLRNHPGTITVRIEGVAASAASFIALAATTVTIEPNAMVMIHDAWGMEAGNAAELRKFADLLDKASQNIAGIYAKGGDPEPWRDAMKEETWYVGQEAVDVGLADSVAVSGGEDDGGEQDPGGQEMAAAWDVHALYEKAPRVKGEPAMQVRKMTTSVVVPSVVLDQIENDPQIREERAVIAAAAEHIRDKGFDADEFRRALQSGGTQ